MKAHAQPHFTKRYEEVTEEKAGGATYTPKVLADFVAQRIVEAASPMLHKKLIRILDPAVGDGELLISMLQEIGDQREIEVYGFETDRKALTEAKVRLSRLFPHVPLQLQHKSFLEFVLEDFGIASSGPLFVNLVPEKFDLIIANPPYVRTQIMGAHQAQLLAEQFNLVGRVDLYYAFLIAMAAVLEPRGVAGIIVSNRFMTTKSGATVRTSMREKFNLRHVWDLGDTKLFAAAILPAVLLVEGKNGQSSGTPAFTSIYETTRLAEEQAINPIAALSREGVIALPDGRRFKVQHGKLDTNGGLDAVWRIATKASDDWLATVEANTWSIFRDIGKIRVGVKTCADKIFIRSDWDTLPISEQPELLRPLTTHHVARRYKALETKKQRYILYPHEIVRDCRQAVNLNKYPRARAYLEHHRSVLEARKYVLEAGREWFEIWVPQDPAAWDVPKLVFRDISEEPIFWIDQCGTIVNGDCYWMIAEHPGMDDLLWLALAVANSTFAERFYDHRFHNKLYAGRRRFITQYVEQFPLPDPQSMISRQIIAIAKAIYDVVGMPEADRLESTLNALVYRAFGLPIEEVTR